MTAREHLSQLPMYYINLDKDVSRHTGFLTEMAPLFGSATRIAGIEGWTLPDEEVVAFRLRHAEHAGKPAPTKWTERVWRIARGMLGCSRSFQLALRTGLEAGHERFVLCEDDARPRLELLDIVEPPGGDMVGWGGMQFAAAATDDALFLSGKPHRWKPLDKPQHGSHGFFCMHCYEVTPRFAEALLEVMALEDRYNDWCWNVLWGPRFTAWQSLPQVFCIRSGNLSTIRGTVSANGRTDSFNPVPQLTQEPLL